MREYALALVKAYLTICAQPLTQPQKVSKMKTTIESLKSCHPQF